MLFPTIGEAGRQIDRHGVDWSKIDTSMCGSDQDYHFYPRRTIQIWLLRPAARSYFRAGYMVFRKNGNASTFDLPNVDALTFQSGESRPNYGTGNRYGFGHCNSSCICLYDVAKVTSACVRLNVGGASKSFTVDPTHQYRFFSATIVADAIVRFRLRCLNHCTCDKIGYRHHEPSFTLDSTTQYVSCISII